MTLTNLLLKSRIEPSVRILFLRYVMLVVVVAMFGGHITELFDRWDHTLRTGKDADYAVVFVAACVGVAFVALKKPVSTLARAWIARKSPASWESSSSVPATMTETSATGPSPPLLIPIRI